MKQGELVFQELITRRKAIHSLLVNSRRLAVELRGLATDNQAQIGDALKQLNTALRFLRAREKQIDKTLTNLGPYASILINIIGTGPWFDAFVPNFASIATGEFKPGKRPRRMTAPLEELLAGVVAVLVLMAGLRGLPGRLRHPHRRRRTSTARSASTRAPSCGSWASASAPSPRSCPRATACAWPWSTTTSTSSPADAKAAIVTPTLTADRFVQIAPAYTDGPVLEDNAKIALPETGTPVELDRIYQSLSDLTQALGPNGANRNGSLDTCSPPAPRRCGQRQARQRDPAQPVGRRADLRRQQRPAVRLRREHVEADRHAGCERPDRGRVHGRPDLGVHPAGRRARQPRQGAGRAGPRRRDRAHLRPRQQGPRAEGRPPADRLARRPRQAEGRR